jgi:hypothetical protein
MNPMYKRPCCHWDSSIAGFLGFRPIFLYAIRVPCTIKPVPDALGEAETNKGARHVVGES